MSLRQGYIIQLLKLCRHRLNNGQFLHQRQLILASVEAGGKQQHFVFSLVKQLRCLLRTIIIGSSPSQHITLVTMFYVV